MRTPAYKKSWVKASEHRYEIKNEDTVRAIFDWFTSDEASYSYFGEVRLTLEEECIVYSDQGTLQLEQSLRRKPMRIIFEFHPKRKKRTPKNLTNKTPEDK